MKPGGTVDRGYGAAHKRERNRWKRIVDSGEASCWRCLKTIAPGDPWDLGHDDNDRTQYRGAEHAECNRAAGANKRHQAEPTTITSREW